MKWTAVELFDRAQVPSAENFTTVLNTVEDIKHSSITIIAEHSFKLCSKFAEFATLWTPNSHKF